VAAGLPGFGLGGLFFILSALLAPGRELWRTARGRSSLAAWRGVGRQFGQALAMLAVVCLTLALVRSGTGPRVALTPIGLTVALLLSVLLVAKLLSLAQRARAARASVRRRPSLPDQVRVRSASSSMR
jgi:Na+/melibiose symporter-like transporter